MDNLSENSSWSEDEVSEFLRSTRIPVRVSVVDGGYPLICSVWFEYSGGKLKIVSHRNSRLARLLTKEGRCAFEIAANESPYFGVRGKADVRSDTSDAEPTLRRLIERYLGDSNEGLANWLLGRIEDEIEFTLHPVWATSWDYRSRMESSA